jgi:hypothetical protein
LNPTLGASLDGGDDLSGLAVHVNGFGSALVSATT